MRNFYLYCEADGYKKPMTCGPRANIGTMAIDLMVKAAGVSRSIVKIGCIPRSDGTNIINIDIDGYLKTITLKYNSNPSKS